MKLLKIKDIIFKGIYCPIIIVVHSNFAGKKDEPDAQLVTLYLGQTHPGTDSRRGLDTNFWPTIHRAA
jgi:hypothetical protein